MCIKLNQTGKIIIPGQTAIIKTKRGAMHSQWGYPSGEGFQANARIETVREKWLNRGYEIGTFEIDSFYEGHGKLETEFKFERPHEVGIIYKDHHFLVVTEEAGKQVSRVHHRQPCYKMLHQLLAA